MTERKLTAFDETIALILHEHGELSISEIQEITKASEEDVETSLSKLFDCGFLEGPT
ncbi:hypothetical protein LCGC14_1183670 [marine sediment metagenome]|uniref:Uncharacterized protein n=1 Tax=marine sediment metagenome TaxID=412755 RepID=A0A0F9P4A5_9ZZZZ